MHFFIPINDRFQSLKSALQCFSFSRFVVNTIKFFPYQFWKKHKAIELKLTQVCRLWCTISHCKFRSALCIGRQNNLEVSVASKVSMTLKALSFDSVSQCNMLWETFFYLIYPPNENIKNFFWTSQCLTLFSVYGKNLHEVCRSCCPCSVSLVRRLGPQDLTWEVLASQGAHR